MGNLGSVETDVNACREPSTPVDTVLLLGKTQEEEAKKGVARGVFEKSLLDTDVRSCNYFQQLEMHYCTG